MEVMVHFVFELFKIAILSGIYASVLKLFFKFLPAKKFGKTTSFIKIFGIFYVCLFIFMFTYYGDHGLGDTARIPIGHWKEITASDNYPYFRPENSQTDIMLKEFIVKNDVLCAEVESSDMNYSGYLVNDLETGSLINLKDKIHYNDFAKKENLPVSGEFTNFYKNYSDYWNGWRFWVLP